MVLRFVYLGSGCRYRSSSLFSSQIEAIGTDAAAADVTPISGYIVFAEAQRYQEIQIASIDDTIPEPSKFFTLQLTNAIDGGRVEFGENTAAFTGETLGITCLLICKFTFSLLRHATLLSLFLSILSSQE